jgi:hypothetical protein
MSDDFRTPKWEVVTEADSEGQRKKARVNSHRLHGIYLVVTGIALMAVAIGLAGFINWISEGYAERNGASHYSEILPGGAVLCGIISICKGIIKIITGA